MINRTWGRKRDEPVEKEASINLHELRSRSATSACAIRGTCRFGGAVPELRSQGGLALAWPVTPLPGTNLRLSALRE